MQLKECKINNIKKNLKSPKLLTAFKRLVLLIVRLNFSKIYRIWKGSIGVSGLVILLNFDGSIIPRILQSVAHKKNLRAVSC